MLLNVRAMYKLLIKEGGDGVDVVGLLTCRLGEKIGVLLSVRAMNKLLIEGGEDVADVVGLLACRPGAGLETP